MEFSNGEKLIILMLSELYEKLGIKGEIDPEFVKSAVFGDHLWALSWKYPGIPFQEAETPAIVSEVVNTLEMWSCIEYSYERLGDEDRELLEAEAGNFGKDPKLIGFDGNNEPSYLGVAHILINQLERFEEFKGRGLNSHMPSVEMHRRMLSEFLPIRDRMMGQPLSVSQLICILKAQTHPDHR